ncbi:hypothetical protein WME75_36025 [Sorangium sp. So ce1014]|uniref:hypothetical protein n=1 Tax=Sorangium sp. So ce1014 TaxID=3133326 RepID=UPI003F63912B
MSPGPTFFSTFNETTVRDRFVAALKRAYDTTCEHHVADRGSNEQMFGFNLYGFAVHELIKEAKDSGSSIKLASRNPTFRLKVNEYEIACHRVGHHATEDIMKCLPKNEGAVSKMHEIQLWLRGLDLGLDKARKLVLGHLGNNEDGFEAAYLCFPGTTKGKRITSWAYAHPIWVKDQHPLPVAVTQQNGHRAPDEKIEDLKPKRREKKDKGDGSQGNE